MKDHISEIMLERYCLNELTKEQREKVERAIYNDPAVKARYEALQESNRDILESYPSPFVAGQIRTALSSSEKVQGSSRLGRNKVIGITLSVAGSTALLAAVFFMSPVTHTVTTDSSVVSIPETAVTDPGVRDIVRTKGAESRLFIYRKTAGEPEELKQNSSAVKGDILQIGFYTRMQYAVIFSIDGRGSVTLHHPINEFASAAVNRGTKVLLDKSYQLDDAPSFERFFLVSSDVGVNTGFVMKKARDFAAKGDAVKTESFTIAGVKTDSFTIRKE